MSFCQLSVQYWNRGSQRQFRLLCWRFNLAHGGHTTPCIVLLGLVLCLFVLKYHQLEGDSLLAICGGRKVTQELCTVSDEPCSGPPQSLDPHRLLQCTAGHGPACQDSTTVVYSLPDTAVPDPWLCLRYFFNGLVLALRLHPWMS